jgi:signal transduction histidine kinase
MTAQGRPAGEHRMLAEVQDELRLYRAFVEAAPQFIALAGLDGSVRYVNPGGRRLAGIPEDVDVTTTTIADYLTPDGLVASVEVEQPAVLRDGFWEGETTLKHWPTGTGIPVRVSSFLVADPASGAPLAMATVQSDLREVVAGREAVLRQVADQRGLLLHLHEAQEAERVRIAGDIHDDTVQVMAAVNIRLQTLRRTLGTVLPPDGVAELDDVDRSVREASTRLRRLLVELDPPAVAGATVADALRTVADGSLGAGDQLRITADVAIEHEPAPALRRVMTRITQEALTNVRKHAQAGTAGVQLREESGEYVLQVVDDGRGIGPGDADARPLHRGIRTIRERADSVGGTATVSRRAAGGTVVEARLPQLLTHPDPALAGPAPRLFLEQVMESITEAYCAVDADWRYVFMNRAGYALLNRDPADPVVGKVIWEEFEIQPEFEDAYRRAREERVQVEVTGYYPPWDRWIYNRVLPTAGGISIFGRDVTREQRADALAARQRRLVDVGRHVVTALTRAESRAGAMADAASALVEGWPVLGVRLRSSDAVLDTSAGEVGGGPSRRVPLTVSARAVGTVELFGEEEPVDDDLLRLIALRLSNDREGGPGGELRAGSARRPGRGTDPF